MEIICLYYFLQLLQNSNNNSNKTQEKCDATNNKSNNNSNLDESNNKKKLGAIKKPVNRKSYKKDIALDESEINSKDLEGSAHEVRARFQLGCECQDDCCFEGLNAENVYK